MCTFLELSICRAIYFIEYYYKILLITTRSFLHTLPCLIPVHSVQVRFSPLNILLHKTRLLSESAALGMLRLMTILPVIRSGILAGCLQSLGKRILLVVMLYSLADLVKNKNGFVILNHDVISLIWTLKHLKCIMWLWKGWSKIHWSGTKQLFDAQLTLVQAFNFFTLARS